MSRILLLALAGLMIVACNQNQGTNDPNRVAGANIAVFNRFEKNNQGKRVDYGPASARTSVQCINSPGVGLTIVAYRMAEKDQTKIEKAWQVIDTNLKANREHTVKLSKAVPEDEKLAESYVAPVIYFDGTDTYEVAEDASCQLLYQRLDNWVKATFACDPETMTSAKGRNSFHIAGNFECQFSPNLTFKINKATLDSLKEDPQQACN